MQKLATSEFLESYGEVLSTEDSEEQLNKCPKKSQKKVTLAL
jgi:hypothetical protein